MTTRAPDIPGTIRADETHLEAIERSLNALNNLHGLTTIAGSRARELTRDIHAHARELERENQITADLLAEALTDLQAANDHEANP